MEKPFNIKLFFLIFFPLWFLAVGYMIYEHYQKNYQICELTDISNIDSLKLYTYYKIDSVHLYMKNIKIDTVTVYDDSGKSFLQVAITGPIYSSRFTKTNSMYTKEDKLMMWQNEDYSYINDFGPIYAWFGLCYDCEMHVDTLLKYGQKFKSELVVHAINEYRKEIASDTNRYFTRIRNSYFYNKYKSAIPDTITGKPIVVEFTYSKNL